MKKFILFYSVFFVLIGIMYGQWKTLNEWVDGWPKFEFVNEDIGWIAGSNSLLKTEDGGETWFSIAAEGYSGIRGIDFLNKSVGWAIANNGNILKTIDGGKCWISQIETETGLTSLYIVDDSTVYVCGDTAFVLRTTNGGEIWQDISRINKNYMLEEILCIDANTSITWGYNYSPDTDSRRIFRTIDGGNYWQHLPHYDFKFRRDLQFVNDSTGYIIASDYSGHYKYILETQDTCSSWSVINTFYLGNISAIKFFPSGTAYAILKENPDAQYSLMKSTDSGVSWEACSPFDDISVRNIYFNNDELGFTVAGGVDGALYKTNDGAVSWEKKNISYPFKDVFFLDQNKGFAGGGFGGFHGARYGSLWFTSDGGNTWSKSPEHPGGYITICSFISDTVGFMLTDGMYGSGFYKSADGGNSWNNVAINFPDSTNSYNLFINDLCFTDNQTGWAVGNFWTEDTSGAVIINSIDGGNNWEFVWDYLDREESDYTLHSIHSYGSNLWAVGESGLIVKYTKQDQWQTIPAVTDLPLKTVFFSDEQHGWISGGYFDEDNVFLKLFKTTDGGDFWEEIPDYNYSINDMFFEDSLHGWAVGGDTDYRGVLLATTNGGITWYKQTNDLVGPLNALHFVGNYGWAVGEYGLVLKTEDKGITWIHSKSVKSYPSKCSLSRNYPNPFNPSTTIKYTLPKSEHVIITVYNTLGQAIETLVSNSMPIGHHQVVFNGDNLPSGVYFYRIEAGEYQQVRKMLLVK